MHHSTTIAAEMVPATNRAGHYQINRGAYGCSVFFNPADVAGVAQSGVVIGAPGERTDQEIAAIIAAHAALIVSKRFDTTGQSLAA